MAVQRKSPVSKYIRARYKRQEPEEEEEGGLPGMFWPGFAVGALAAWVILRMFGHS